MCGDPLSDPVFNLKHLGDGIMQLRLIIAALACLAASCGFVGTPGMAGQIEQKRFAAKAYPNSRDRDYKVFIPSSYTGQSAVPMVVLLHGCSQTDQNMI
jgi:poly(3-hydroxybutyrate) depolymerase